MNKNKFIFPKYILLILMIGLLLGTLIGKSIYNNSEDDVDDTLYYGLNETLYGKANILAVDNNFNGVIGKVNVKIISGNGDILINTNPFLEPNTQYSAVIASQVASNITKIDLSNSDIIIDYEIGEAQVVGGPSSGLSLTLSMISALKGKPLKNIGYTGEILPNGDISEVGGIFEKAEATANNNLTMFLIPSRQSIFYYYEPIETKKNVNGVIYINTKYVLKQINLTKYFDEEYNLKIVEIKNVQEAMEYAF